MTVLHVLPFPGVGGTEIATRRIMDAAAGFGIRSRALLLNPSEQVTSYFEDAGIPVQIAKTVPDPSFRRGWRFLLDSKTMGRELRSAGANLVHCADILAAYHVVAACRMSGTPVLCHVRNRYSEISVRDRFFMRWANHFAFVSRHTREGFGMNLPPDKTSVLYDGIDIALENELTRRGNIAREVRQELGIHSGIPIAAMFARVAPQKDYETLIRAARILQQRATRFCVVVVGDFLGSEEQRSHYDRIQRLIAEQGVSGHFLFLGFRPDARRLMLAADICVLSTNWEGLPLVLLESMAVARPVIATAVDGVPEVIEDGVTGWLTPHGDAGALANRMHQLLADPESATLMGRAARDDVRRRFSRERFAADVHNLYQRLTS